jgi:hypothetical protein
MSAFSTVAEKVDAGTKTDAVSFTLQTQTPLRGVLGGLLLAVVGGGLLVF